MALFIRFSNTIEDDIKRNTSILTNHNNLIVDGLCVFYAGENIEEARIKGSKLAHIVGNDNEIWSIMSGMELVNSPSGTLGTVATELTIIEKHVTN